MARCLLGREDIALAFGHPRDRHFYTAAVRLLGALDEGGRPVLEGLARPGEEREALARALEGSRLGKAWVAWAGAAALGEVDPGSARAFLAACSDLSPSTAARRAGTLRRWLSWCLEPTSAADGSTPTGAREAVPPSDDSSLQASRALGSAAAPPPPQAAIVRRTGAGAGSPVPKADLAADRLRLFAFTQAEHRERYLALLRLFDQAREQSRLQLSAIDVMAVDGLDTLEVALAALDQLHDWRMLDRFHDDRRVRTVTEYRNRSSIYQMTELGWLAWTAVETVLAAEPGEAELKRLALPAVLEQLRQLDAALERQDAEQAAFCLDSVQRTLADLAHHAARFTLATSELASAWESDPASFLQHKNRLLGHLDGFLSSLSALRPALGTAVAALDGSREDLIRLVAEASTALDGRDRAEARISRQWEGVVAWFVGQPERPSQAAQLEERTSRAIRDLALLLKRVLDATAGGVSRATQLEALARWFMACPDDAAAHALAAASSGMSGARHFGAPEADPDATGPSMGWWDAPPSPVDTTLRKLGRTSAPPPPQPLPNRSRESQLLRLQQRAAREADAAAGRALVQTLALGRPLDDAELAVLLRLLSRALHTRRPASGSAHTVRGGLRLRVLPARGHAVVPTVRGTLILEDHHLEVAALEPVA
jgi:uncharacterized protein (TIGR02677 family)